MSLEKEEKDICLFEFEKLLNQVDPYNPEMLYLLDVANDIDPDLHDVCSFSLWIKMMNPQEKFDLKPKEAKDSRDLDIIVLSPVVLKAFIFITFVILTITGFALGR